MKDTVRITITTTRRVKEFLDRMIPFGLYGNSTAEVAERLVCESLRSRTIKQEIKILEGESK